MRAYLLHVCVYTYNCEKTPQMNEFDWKIVEIKSGKGQYDAACSYIN